MDVYQQAREQFIKGISRTTNFSDEKVGELYDSVFDLFMKNVDDKMTDQEAEEQMKIRVRRMIDNCQNKEECFICTSALSMLSSID